MYGTLYLCGTPIGNLGDITLRVLEIFKSCDIIAAEDTRNTLKLLNHFGIEKSLISYHEHNKFTKGPVIMERLKDGENVALVTDAGMPGISDPGTDLVRECLKEGIPVTSAPGPTAFATALVISGFDSRRFVFEGFLPQDKKEKAIVLKSLRDETRTVIFYEAPHRLKATLEEIYKSVGNRKCACVREITKKYEEVKTGNLDYLIEYYSENEPRGEFVLIIEGAKYEDIREKEIKSWEAMSVSEHVGMYISKGLDEKEAMKQAAKDRGVSKRDIYSVFKGGR